MNRDIARNRRKKERTERGTSWPGIVSLSLLVIAVLGLGTPGSMFGPRALALIPGLPDRLLAADAVASLGVAQTFKHPGHVSVVAISPDSQYLAAGGLLERSISVWNLKTGRLAQRFVPEQGTVSAFAWSPDSALLASGRSFVRIAADHTAIDVWHVASGRRVHALPDAFAASSGSSRARTLAFSPDGTRLAAALSGL